MRYSIENGGTRREGAPKEDNAMKRFIVLAMSLTLFAACSDHVVQRESSYERHEQSDSSSAMRGTTTRDPLGDDLGAGGSRVEQRSYQRRTETRD
jgi:hypothetical protein